MLIHNALISPDKTKQKLKFLYAIAYAKVFQITLSSNFIRRKQTGSLKKLRDKRETKFFTPKKLTNLQLLNKLMNSYFS